MELPSSTKEISPAAAVGVTSLSPMPIQKLQRGPPSNEAILTSNSTDESLKMPPSDAELKKKIDEKMIRPKQILPSTQQQTTTHGFSIDNLLTSQRQNRRRRSTTQFDSENGEPVTKMQSRQIDEKRNPFPSSPIAQCQEKNLLGPNQGNQPGTVNLADWQNAIFMGQTAAMENLLALARETLAREQQQQSNQQQGGKICTASQERQRNADEQEQRALEELRRSGSSSAPNLSIIKKNDKQITLAAAKFPPYIRQIVQNGQKQFANLEEIMFGKPVPARLPLLNNKKYPISLAEIHRRLSIPECLNNSYLNGILRRDKNKDFSSKLREELAEYDCGLQLHTGLHQSDKVTTYTALCEREALQLAQDFGKIANDPQNGFPHQQLALELNRRSMEHSSQKLEDVKGAMKLLRSAISILEQSIGQETLQLGRGQNANAAVDDHQQLTPQTLDQFKRFARLSHCFGNRAMLIFCETMLKVFGHFEGIQQSGGDAIDNGQSSSSGFMAAGTSQQQNDEQMSANSLLEFGKK